MKKFTAMIILVAMLMVVACSNQNNVDNTVLSDVTTTNAETTVEYDYSELDLGGRTFTILNTAQDYDFYTTLDLEEQTGDSVDDEIYNRNRALEERYNFVFEINEEYLLDKAAAALQTAVLASDDIYDAAFLRDNYMSAVITEGYLVDLQNHSTLRFDEPWWDGEAIKESRIGDNKSIYYAYTDISLADFEGTIVCFFNEDILSNLSMEVPYQLVRDGVWTFDRYSEYTKAGANLNGAESFKWEENGTAVYGMTTWDQGEIALIIGANCDFITMKNNYPVFSATGERFMTVAQKVISMLSVDGEYFYGNGGGNSHYEAVFKNGRALMMLAQLKATNKYRDMEAAYGIVPLPKYDETQESYRNLRSYTYVMCIPVISDTVDETAIIMDAMSYLTYKDVMNPYYSGRVSQKALRNEDSIEMLALINANRTIDVGFTYGWSSTLRSQIRSAVTNKSTEIASVIASLEGAIEENIKKTMDMINSN